MTREGFIRPRGPNSVRHPSRQKQTPDASPAIPTQAQADAEMARLLNEELLKEQQNKQPNRHNTQSEQAKPAKDEEVAG